jgi:perosamine synthetase
MVAVPAVSFVAAANAVTHLGAVPMFVDVEPHGLGMNPQVLDILLGSSGKIVAVIAVHVLGHPCMIKRLCDVALRHGVPVVEDAAEALGSQVFIDSDISEFPELHPCGSFGHVSVLSFNLNKIVTTGGGGAVMIDNTDLAANVRRLATTSKVPTPSWEVRHDAVAWNHRISMLAGALGSSQIVRLESIVSAKRALAQRYRDVFSSINGVAFCDEPDDTRSNFWLPSIMVPPDDREAVLTALNGSGLGARALFFPIDQMMPYRGTRRACRIADASYRSTVCLPGGIDLARRFL